MLTAPRALLHWSRSQEWTRLAVAGQAFYGYQGLEAIKEMVFLNTVRCQLWAVRACARVRGALSCASAWACACVCPPPQPCTEQGARLDKCDRHGARSPHTLVAPHL